MNSTTKERYLRFWDKGKRFSLLVIFCTTLTFTGSNIAFAAEKNKDQNSTQDIAVGVASLFLQPVYLAVKLAIGISGTAISGLTLVGTGGNEELAGEIFKKSWASPWGIPGLLENKEEDTQITFF